MTVHEKFTPEPPPTTLLRRVKMAQEIDTKGTPSPVCPHCGYNGIYGLDLIVGGVMDGEADCDRCGREFTFRAVQDITWTTKKEPA